ncbi:MAG: hypothetical protein IT319_00905 [Anaerolineae bacterium]|nr:hypothetical protein [Anaerolineae bacterium]
MMHIFRNRALFLVLVMLFAACSGAAEPTPTTARPTVTSIPVFEYVPPTEVPQLATLAVMTATAVENASALDPVKVERGSDRYVALECGSCHGDSGEGTDQGSALTTFAMSEADFISFMRSGGSMGAEHQYSTNRLSTSGGSNLYQYLLSLSSSQ